ncbi:hypothetical protein FVER53590_25767 [Fusarium verticillioides]|nr:hypothetical protein FVER53590_25767 [Fusarium verticillioides]
MSTPTPGNPEMHARTKQCPADPPICFDVNGYVSPSRWLPRTATSRSLSSGSDATLSDSATLYANLPHHL